MQRQGLAKAAITKTLPIMKNIRYAFLTTVAILGLLSGRIQAQTFDAEEGKNALQQLQKFNQFYRYLNSVYVDTVNNSRLIEKAITEVLQQLDPHSSYLSAEEMVGVRETFDGSFSGIGIEFNVLHDTIIVVNVIAGGPSEAVGLLPNDRIVTVDGKNVVGTKQMGVPKLLRGPKGSRVELGVVRSGAPEMLDFRIVRDNIPINTVDAAYKLDSLTGYIRVNRFANQTYKEFEEAFRKLGPVDALVLDLRSNGGGLLDQAVELSNFFLPKGAVIVSTEGRHVPPIRLMAMKDGTFKEGKVIVLTNEFSASGSEIVAGAIQDWDRGLIIGRRTFGKGLVQRQFPLQDSSAVRITVARYHTPSGRVIQRPYEKGKRDEYEMDLIKRIQHDSTASAMDSSQVFKTLRSGRTVYGGGGIAPDITVETDTLPYTDYWSALIRQGILVEYVISYMDHHRKELERLYPTVERYLQTFQPDEAMLEELQQAAARKDIKPSDEDLKRSRQLILTQLKALIAQKLWGMNEYFMVANQQDETIEKAREVLQEWSRFSQGILSSSKN